MELPASEIAFWKSYYSIFPLPQEREDQRFAKLISFSTYMNGRTLKQPIPMEILLPDYLGERNSTEKSLEQQSREFKEFKAKLNSYNSKSLQT